MFYDQNFNLSGPHNQDNMVRDHTTEQRKPMTTEASLTFREVTISKSGEAEINSLEKPTPPKPGVPRSTVHTKLPTIQSSDSKACLPENSSETNPQVESLEISHFSKQLDSNNQISTYAGPKMVKQSTCSEPPSSNFSDMSENFDKSKRSSPSEILSTPRTSDSFLLASVNTYNSRGKESAFSKLTFSNFLQDNLSSSNVDKQKIAEKGAEVSEFSIISAVSGSGNALRTHDQSNLTESSFSNTVPDDKPMADKSNKDSKPNVLPKVTKELSSQSCSKKLEQSETLSCDSSRVCQDKVLPEKTPQVSAQSSSSKTVPSESSANTSFGRAVSKSRTAAGRFLEKSMHRGPCEPTSADHNKLLDSQSSLSEPCSSENLPPATFESQANQKAERPDISNVSKKLGSNQVSLHADPKLIKQSSASEPASSDLSNVSKNLDKSSKSASFGMLKTPRTSDTLLPTSVDTYYTKENESPVSKVASSNVLQDNLSSCSVDKKSFAEKATKVSEPSSVSQVDAPMIHDQWNIPGLFSSSTVLDDEAIPNKGKFDSKRDILPKMKKEVPAQNLNEVAVQLSSAKSIKVSESINIAHSNKDKVLPEKIDGISMQHAPVKSELSEPLPSKIGQSYKGEMLQENMHEVITHSSSVKREPSLLSNSTTQVYQGESRPIPIVQSELKIDVSKDCNMSKIASSILSIVKQEEVGSPAKKIKLEEDNLPKNVQNEIKEIKKKPDNQSCVLPKLQSYKRKISVPIHPKELSDLKVDECKHATSDFATLKHDRWGIARPDTEARPESPIENVIPPKHPQKSQLIVGNKTHLTSLSRLGKKDYLWRLKGQNEPYKVKSSNTKSSGESDVALKKSSEVKKQEFVNQSKQLKDILPAESVSVTSKFSAGQAAVQTDSQSLMGEVTRFEKCSLQVPSTGIFSPPKSEPLLSTANKFRQTPPLTVPSISSAFSSSSDSTVRTSSPLPSFLVQASPGSVLGIGGSTFIPISPADDLEAQETNKMFKIMPMPSCSSKDQGILQTTSHAVRGINFDSEDGSAEGQRKAKPVLIDLTDEGDNKDCQLEDVSDDENPGSEEALGKLF